MSHEPASADSPPERAAWPTWLVIGATGFGGPAGQVAILHREVVERRRWLDEDEFIAALRLCMLLPGPEAQQVATYAGWRLAGIPGGLVAGALFVLPGALLVTALAWLHAVGRDVPLVAAAIARLFTETTLLSFGGAYAVVPWALDESVARGWLEPGERFAALAMGEATPGPLILVVTFIGFLAGWKATPAAAVADGLAGAGTATLFAFLPSFAMVLALAPAVRSIHAGSGVGRALAGVGAAVVAAIAILAVTLARAAFLEAGRVDLVSLAVAALAAVALGRVQASTPLVVLAAAGVGILRSLP